MYYETETEIDKLLQELNIDILEIDDGYTPTEIEENLLSELYDVFEIGRASCRERV